ncbi:MAG: ribosome silencing factor [Alphaproteobacteria bacterium]
MTRNTKPRSRTAIRTTTRAAKAAKPGKAIKNDPLALSKQLLEQVLVSLDDDKAEDVVTIELSGKSTIADYMVIASGSSHRHLSTMAEHLCEALKAAGVRRVTTEGAARAEWILIDGGDVIVHLFRPEVREFYGLEKMWGIDMTRDAKVAGRAQKSP